jgi:hypothetical protein
MGIILIMILVLLLIGALPTWRHSKFWGPFPSGGIGLIRFWSSCCYWGESEGVLSHVNQSSTPTT